MAVNKKKRVTKKKQGMDGDLTNKPQRAQHITEGVKKNVICVIGMHRSGTSMVARLLNLCGLDLGPPEELLEPQEDNPLGFFENKGFLNINEELLTHLGGSWDNPPNLEKKWQNKPSLDQIVKKARALIKTFSKSDHWGWKDPRTNVLLPFWKSIIPDMRFVICVRSPVEVAKSLANRNSMPLNRGVYLWNQYMQAAVRDTEGHPRIFTFYEDFFEDLPYEIDKLIAFCGLQKPRDMSAIREAVSNKLRHYTSETSELLNESKVLAEYKILYIGLRAIANDKFLGPILNNKREELISKNIKKFVDMLQQFHNEQEVLQLQSELAEKEQQNIKLHTIMHQQEKELSEKEQQMSEFQATVSSQSQQLEDKEHKLDLLKMENERLVHEKEHIQSTLQAQQQALEEQEQQISNLKTEQQRLANEKEQIQATVQSQKQELEDKEQQIVQLKAEQERLVHEKEQIQATVQSRNQELEDKEQQIVQVKAEQERLVHEKEQIQATVQSQKQELEDKEMQVAELRINIASNEQMLKQQSDSLKYAAAEKQQLKQLLEIVHNSLGWRWISKIHSIENKLMPISSYRRNYYDILWKILKTDIFSKSKRHKVRKKKDCRVTK
jgi:hypothetical protein